MAARSGGARERLSKIADKLSLQDILEAFNAPLNEEQAWAICFQCLQHLKKHWDAGNAIYIYGLPSVYVHKDGTVSCEAPTTGKQSTECQIIESLGLVLFSALDYGLPENEEQRLSPLLESAIARMTGNDADKSSSDAGHDDGCHSDEGIAEDEDEDGGQGQSVTFQDVIQDCINHLHSPGEAASHYKAVCRALLAEAQELLTFLVNISLCREKLKAEDGEEDLEDLQRADWARLWMQVMKTLRKGVKLKEVEHVNKPPVEYELTPYEILMEDIRSRRYTLNKVAANGALPPKLKQNAHEIILDFIRSRPPLHPVTNRKLANPRPRTPDLHEQLISEIKNPPKLRSTPYEEEVEDEEKPAKPVPFVPKTPRMRTKLNHWRSEETINKSMQDVRVWSGSQTSLAANSPAFVNYSPDPNTIDYHFKLLVIGGSNVGKSSFILRYSDNKYSPAFVATIGIDFRIKNIKHRGRTVQLQIWDTAGQERYRTITTACFRGTMGFVLMYDITSEQSFNMVEDWLTQIRENADEKAPVIIVGHKCDLEDKREVSYELAQKLADDLEVDFYEASAKEDYHVSLVFDKLVDKITRVYKPKARNFSKNTVRLPRRAVSIRRFEKKWTSDVDKCKC
ncbi:protein spire homolog 1 isoform X2 [Lingula anatina]|uniref:Protein spire homolog 1 isoform X2 n=1 Tax=Lingula anatina TaxID=7574 RepID=A0A1S3JL10_LINAN|nr:protein spire homolog 1 isoform X2 [Lingula anatina]|eukprot:XP_013411068.1 protein spire homolog 1 isoform X2 [Lingula anatina]